MNHWKLEKSKGRLTNVKSTEAGARGLQSSPVAVVTVCVSRLTPWLQEKGQNPNVGACWVPTSWGEELYRVKSEKLQRILDTTLIS